VNAFPGVPLPPELASTATQKLVDAQDTDWRALLGSMLVAADHVPPTALVPELGRPGLAALVLKVEATELLDGPGALVPLLPQAATASKQATTAAASGTWRAAAGALMTLHFMLVSPCLG